MRYIILLMIIAINAGCHRNGDKMEIEPLFVYAGRDSINHEQLNNFIVSHFCYCGADNFTKKLLVVLGLIHTLFENLLEFFRIKSSFRDNIPFGLLYNVIPMVQKEMC